jgi:hypothetical protein
MQVLFTIEVRVDCEVDKCRLAKHAVRQAALRLYGGAALWDEGSEVTAYSHDYQNGRLDISLGETSRRQNVKMEAMRLDIEKALRGCRPKVRTSTRPMTHEKHNRSTVTRLLAPRRRQHGGTGALRQ